MWQKSSVFSHESAQRNVAGYLIDKNVFKTTRSFRYQWFRVSTHQANANKPFIFSNMKRATGGIFKMDWSGQLSIYALTRGGGILIFHSSERINSSSRWCIHYLISYMHNEPIIGEKCDERHTSTHVSFALFTFCWWHHSRLPKALHDVTDLTRSREKWYPSR